MNRPKRLTHMLVPLAIRGQTRVRVQEASGEKRVRTLSEVVRRPGSVEQGLDVPVKGEDVFTTMRFSRGGQHRVEVQTRQTVRPVPGRPEGHPSCRAGEV